MELPSALPSPSPKKQKKCTRIKSLMLARMELSSSNIKKILIFSQKKAFLTFQEAETPSVEHMKIPCEAKNKT